jgi:hypothetical protein
MGSSCLDTLVERYEPLVTAVAGLVGSEVEP